jgi:hypothetical protein
LDSIKNLWITKLWRRTITVMDSTCGFHNSLGMMFMKSTFGIHICGFQQNSLGMMLLDFDCVIHIYGLHMWIYWGIGDIP